MKTIGFFSQNALWFLAALPLMGSLACTKSCGKKSPPVENPALKEEAMKEEPKPEGVKAQITQFPSLSFDGLSVAQKTAAIGLFNEELCPCGCPKTFAACINMKSGCDSARVLAQWILDRLADGVHEQVLFQAISEEINQGLNGPEKTINTANSYHKGPETAKLKIIEFADFECSACKIAAMATKTLMQKYPNDIQLIFKHLPLPMHPKSMDAAIAAEAAGRQKKFWEMHDALFSYPSALTDDTIASLAQKIGLNVAQFNKDKQDPALKTKVEADKNEAMNQLGLSGTPSFYFNGRPYQLSFSLDGFEVGKKLEELRVKNNCNAP